MIFITLFISACSSSSEQNNADSDNKDKAVDEDAVTNDTEMTEDEAKEEVFDYIKENEPEIKDFLDTYQFSVEKNNDNYHVDMFYINDK
jgi:membrane-bound ClpP family serine protease